MTTLRVHFDGRVFVPEGPVDLPQGKSFEIELPVAGEVREFRIRRNEISGLPEFDLPVDAPVITMEDVHRALDDE